MIVIIFFLNYYLIRAAIVVSIKIVLTYTRRYIDLNTKSNRDNHRILYHTIRSSVQHKSVKILWAGIICTRY